MLTADQGAVTVVVCTTTLKTHGLPSWRTSLSPSPYRALLGRTSGYECLHACVTTPPTMCQPSDDTYVRHTNHLH